MPYPDENGVFAGFIGSCVDVDERHRAQVAQQQHTSEQLALARDFEKWILAKAHGGGPEVDSAGGGTTFRLVLPRTTPAELTAT